MQVNVYHATKGITTSTKEKVYPPVLRQWVDFEESKKQLFDNMCHFFHPPNESHQGFFHSRQYLKELGEELGKRKYGSEMDVVTYERLAVEGFATDIINELCKMPGAREKFNLGEGIIFENHQNPLTGTTKDQTAKEVVESIPPYTPGKKAAPSRLKNSASASEPVAKPDQFCIHKNLGGDDIELLFVCEYKAPHKLTLDNIRLGFRDMDLKEDVFSRVDAMPRYTKPPTDGRQLTREEEDANEARLRYQSDQLAAAVSTQIYDAMIKFGLEFSYITTGQAFILFRVKKEDPRALYYHVAVPDEDVGTHGLSCTAVSQVLGLCLMAFKSSQRPCHWRTQWMEKLPKRTDNSEEYLDQIPETTRTEKTASSYKAPKRKAVHRLSPVRTRKRSRATCSTQSEELVENNDGGTDDEDDDSQDNFWCRSAAEDAKTKDRLLNDSAQQCDAPSSPTEADRTAQEYSLQRDLLRKQPFCTQACLSGLADGSALDLHCPNASFHTSLRKSTSKHRIGAEEISRMIQQQLATDPDRGCIPLNLRGARGQLFKIRLLSHGYTFVAKGTSDHFSSCLEHEAAVYEHLKSFQGQAIPVCFGIFRLRQKYYLQPGIVISHMLLLSWGGAAVRDWKEHYASRCMLIHEIRKAGVEQGDERDPNFLWNEEIQRLVLIDFERAKLLQQVPLPLRDTTMNRPGKKYNPEEDADTRPLVKRQA